MKFVRVFISYMVKYLCGFACVLGCSILIFIAAQENIEKYVISEIANETLPFPSGNSTLDTYGNVISGNINDDIVKMAFIIKFFFCFPK